MPKYTIKKTLYANRAALQFLAFGFTFDDAAFRAVLDQLRETVRLRQDSLKADSSPANPVTRLRDTLLTCTRDALKEAGAEAVQMGVTGGMDSRLLYAAVREILPEDRIFTYTVGYRGQYDFEFARKYGERFLPNHHLIDTNVIAWDFEAEVRHKVGLSQPECYSANRRISSYRIEKLGAPEPFVHGFMGGALTGGTKPDRHKPVLSWSDAVSRFLRKNDRFRLQSLFSGTRDLTTLLPANPNLQIPGLDDYDFLDFGLRQYQRIMCADRRNNRNAIIPYADTRWISALLSCGDLADREPIYYDFLKSWAPDVFFEVAEGNLSSRKEQLQFRIRVTEDAAREVSSSDLRNSDGTPYCEQVRNGAGNVLAGRQFCERAEYANNPTFRALVDTCLDRLRRRRLFPEAFIDETYDQFMDMNLGAAERIKGLIAFELNATAGKFEKLLPLVKLQAPASIRSSAGAARETAV